MDAGDDQQLETLQVTLRAGLTRLVTTLRAVAPRSLVIVMTPVPRVGLSEQHLGAFDVASQMCDDVATECGGHVLAVCDVVATPTVGRPTSYDWSGNHLSHAAGVAIDNAVQDIVLGTFPVGQARQ